MEKIFELLGQLIIDYGKKYGTNENEENKEILEIYNNQEGGNNGNE